MDIVIKNIYWGIHTFKVNTWLSCKVILRLYLHDTERDHHEKFYGFWIHLKFQFKICQIKTKNRY